MKYYTTHPDSFYLLLLTFKAVISLRKKCSECAAAAAKSLQSCPTLCNPIDGSPPGSPVPGILQARTLGWAAISFSSAWKWKVKVKSLSRVRLLATPWSAAYQAPPSMDFPGKGAGVGAIAFSIRMCSGPQIDMISVHKDAFIDEL